MSIEDWTAQKYPSADRRLVKLLSGIEEHNPNLPPYVELPSEQRPVLTHGNVMYERYDEDEL